MKRHPQQDPNNPWNITAAELALIAAHFVVKPINPLGPVDACKEAHKLWQCANVFLKQLRRQWDENEQQRHEKQTK
jgi:hypothetical protein